jgi:hypothetical protein
LRRCTRRYSSQRDEFYHVKQIPRRRGGRPDLTACMGAQPKPQWHGRLARVYYSVNCRKQKLTGGKPVPLRSLGKLAQRVNTFMDHKTATLGRDLISYSGTETKK